MTLKNIYSVFLSSGEKIVSIDFYDCGNHIKEVWIRDLELLCHTFDSEGRYIRSEGLEEEKIKLSKETTSHILRTTLKEVFQKGGK